MCFRCDSSFCVTQIAWEEPTATTMDYARIISACVTRNTLARHVKWKLVSYVATQSHVPRENGMHSVYY